MHITQINLKNFKRFTDLEITGIPPNTSLVVIVGPNGSGKSSLFDAMLHWYKTHTGHGFNNADQNYYKKHESEAFDFTQAVKITTAEAVALKRGDFYLRTAYRNDPDFTIKAFSKQEAPTESIRVNKAIENDQTVSVNYQRLLYDTMSGVYDESNDKKTVPELRHELIGRVQKSMRNVFEDLTLNNIVDPLGTGTFFFGKGTVGAYHYKNLSGGEKAAFDILLDIHLKKKFFPDALYCIDEVETHLHTKMQGRLLRELVKIMPVNAQLWVTTHSLGILRAAQELDQLTPGSVCVIDFDVIDPDIPRSIRPSSLDRVTWEKMLSIALDDLSPHVAPKVAILCEGSSVGSRRRDFDAEIYNRILASKFPGIVFISGGSSTQIEVNGVSVRKTLDNVLPSTKVITLCDRDDRSAREVADIEREGGLVLPWRNLESFLFDDEVLQALAEQQNKLEKLTEIKSLKNLAISESVKRGNAGDDLKSAAGEIYVGLKKILELQKCGNDKDTFMRDTLSILVNPEMEVFKVLKKTIVDKAFQ